MGDCFPYIKNGYNARQGKDKGGVPITRIETLSDNKYNRNKVGYANIFSTEGLEKYVLEDGDILMSHINSLPYLGRSVMYRARPGEVFIHGMNLLRLKADRSIVEPEYAELYFRSPRFKQQVSKIAKKAVNQASFSVSNLKELEFPLMSLCDQRDVIKKLSFITAQIEYNQKAIGELSLLVKSRFVEMFEGGQEWELRTLADCCATSNDIKCGPFGSQLHKEDYASEGVPVWGIPEVNSNFERMPDKYVSPENGLRLQSYSLVPGDVAMNRKGNVGQAALFDGKRPSGIIHSDVLRVRVNQDVLDPVFLVEQLHSSHVVREQVLSASTGAIMAGTNVTKLKMIKVFAPPLALQQEFASFASQVDKSRFVAQQQIEKLQMLYDSLAQEYFGD